MKPFATRLLTTGECDLAREMFGSGLSTAKVRILAVPLWPRAFVAGPTLVVWPAAQVPADFSRAPVLLQSVLIHELTHVWQAQNGVGLLWAKLKAGDSASSYAYALGGDLPFSAMNIEQQAMVVQHAFLASRGVATPFPAREYADAARYWRGG